MKKILKLVFTFFLSFVIVGAVLAQDASTEIKPTLFDGNSSLPVLENNSISNNENLLNNSNVNVDKEKILVPDVSQDTVVNKITGGQDIVTEEKNNKKNIIEKQPEPIIQEILWRQVDWNKFVFVASGIQLGEGDVIIWQFGDGQSSSELMPTHSYEISGTYSIKMIFKNNSGEEIILKKNLEIPIFYIANPRLWVVLGIVLGVSFLVIVIASFVDRFREKGYHGGSLDEEEDDDTDDTNNEEEVVVDDMDWEEVETLQYKDDDLKELEENIRLVEKTDEVASEPMEEVEILDEEVMEDLKRDKVAEVIVQNKKKKMAQKKKEVALEKISFSKKKVRKKRTVKKKNAKKKPTVKIKVKKKLSPKARKKKV